MFVQIPDVQAMEALGRSLALALPDGPPYPAILLTGPLGAGKTTLTRGLVHALPGGEEAEVSSPSFNICNVYPTRPQVTHCDLYRVGQQGVDDELMEDLGSRQALAVVEWAEFLSPEALPGEYVLVALEAGAEGRRIRLAARGGDAEKLLVSLEQSLRRDHPDIFTQ